MTDAAQAGPPPAEGAILSARAASSAGTRRVTLGRVVCAGRGEGDEVTLDIADADALRAAMRELAPAMVVNAAAYTAVDRAESEPEAACAAKIEPGGLGEEAARLGIPVVHAPPTTSFGDATRAYREDEADRTTTLGAYEAHQAAGEAGLRATGATDDPAHERGTRPAGATSCARSCKRARA